MIVEQERLGQGEGKGKGRGVDRVVVELTGVADPGKLDDISLDNPFPT
jgi:G3E family GTPase